MGEYYIWVNVDKKEYLGPSDFNVGNKLQESLMAGNALLGALYQLLSSDWNSDTVLFLGDQTRISEKNSNQVLQRLSAEQKRFGVDGFTADYIFEEYKCVSGLFRAAEAEVRQEIAWMIENGDFRNDPYRVNRDSPYEGLFLRDLRFFRYTVNHTKKEYFDINYTKIGEGAFTAGINPLPLLMAFPGDGDARTGIWIGDRIEVRDDRPSENYKDVSKLYGALC